MSVELQTDRLLLRPLQLADAEQAQPLFAQLGSRQIPERPSPVAVSGGWSVPLLSRPGASGHRARGAVALDAAIEGIAGDFDWVHRFVPGVDRQSRLLAGVAMAWPGVDDRGGDCRQ